MLTFVSQPTGDGFVRGGSFDLGQLGLGTDQGCFGLRYTCLSLCYCSLYGDCFETRLFQRPEEVEACAALENPFMSHGFFRN